MLINGSTTLLGIVGQKIAHTLSPLIHNSSAAYLGLNTVYVPLAMPATNLASFLKVFWDMGGVGFNVTTPHKQIVASMVPGHHLESINTVYRGPEGWQGASTDGEGFARSLQRLGTPLGGFRKVVFLGNGGATLAILGYLAQHFEKHLETVVLRRKAAFDDVMTKIMPSSFTLRFRDFSLGNLQEELFGRSGDTLLIQATSAPLRGEDLRSLCPALEKFHGVVVDLVYGTPSRLLTMAKERGLLAQDGVPMLIEQARLSQQFWWQKSAPYEVIAEALGRQGYGL